MPMRYFAASQLHFMRREAAPAIEALVSVEAGTADGSHQDLDVHMAASSALAAIGLPARAAVLRALESDDVDRRLLAADTLFQSPKVARRAVRELCCCVEEDPEGRVRTLAVRALGACRRRASVVLPVVRAALDDPYLGVRYGAQETLEKLEDR